LSIHVEFDGRFAAVAREESNDKRKTKSTDLIVLRLRLFLPTRAFGRERDVCRQRPKILLDSYAPVQELLLSLLLFDSRTKKVPSHQAG
jgi:hypothetical protein